MHVQEIELVNFKTIKEFKGQFEGNVYLVTGENGIGKSTLIQAIGILLTGNRSDNLLKKGEKTGFAKMTVGNGPDSYEVELRFSETNPRGTLVIGKKDSGLKSDRKSALESIFKYQDFDANEFLRWSETAEGRRRQAELVKSLLPEEIQNQINELDYQVAQALEKRTEIGREMKLFEGQVKTLFVTEEEQDKFSKSVDVSQLAEQHREASEKNQKRAGVIERKQAREKELIEIPVSLEKSEKATFEKIDFLEIRLKEIQAEIEQAKKDLGREYDLAKAKEAELKKQNEEAEKWISQNPEIELSEIQSKIKNSEEHNKKAIMVQQYKEAFSKLQELAEKHANFEKIITEGAANKKALIESAKLPVDGLDFSEEGITLNGIPFREGEVATSEAMEVAVSLIVAKNPTTKIFRVAQGESLGEDRLRAIVDFAKKRGYQGFIEEMKRGQNELVVFQYSEK